MLYSTRYFGRWYGVTAVAVAVGDLDGDSDLDIVHNAGGGIVVYLNDGKATSTGMTAPTISGPTAPTIQAQTWVLPLLWRWEISIAMAALISPTGNIYSQHVVYLNDGTGSFMNSRRFGSGPSGPRFGNDSVAVVVGDLDGDSDLDLVTGNAYDKM